MDMAKTQTAEGGVFASLLSSPLLESPAERPRDLSRAAGGPGGRAGAGAVLSLAARNLPIFALDGAVTADLRWAALQSSLRPGGSQE